MSRRVGRRMDLAGVRVDPPPYAARVALAERGREAASRLSPQVPNATRPATPADLPGVPILFAGRRHLADAPRHLGEVRQPSAKPGEQSHRGVRVHGRSTCPHAEAESRAP